MNIPKLEPLVFFRQNGKDHLLSFNLNKGIYEEIACGECYERHEGIILFFNQGFVHAVFVNEEQSSVHVFRGIYEKDLLWVHKTKIIFSEGEKIYSYDYRKKLKDLGSSVSDSYWLFANGNHVAFITQDCAFYSFGNVDYRFDSDGKLWLMENGETKSFLLQKR